MKQFNEINPLTITQDPRVVASIQDDRKPHKTYYFLIDGKYIIIANTNWKENKNGSIIKSSSLSKVYCGI